MVLAACGGGGAGDTRWRWLHHRAYPNTAQTHALAGFGISQLTQATLVDLFISGSGYVDITDQGAGGTDPWALLSSQYPGLVQVVQNVNQALSP